MGQHTSAVLFDLDGTLLDTAPDLGHALNRVLADHHRAPIPLALSRPYASHGSHGLLTLGFGQAYNSDTKAALREQFLAYYSQDICVDSRLFAEVPELLQQLAKLQLPVAIVTNKPTLYTELLLPHFPQLAAIPVVVCGDTLSVAKPSPEPLLHACQLLSKHHERTINTAHAIYVGDAERDIAAGSAAGMRTVVADYGYIGEQENSQTWQADFHIQRPQQLLLLL